MVKAGSKPLTLAEFLELPETKPASEYINGNIIQKPMPKGRHSRLQGKLCSTINQVAEDARIAYAFPELRCSFGGRSIIPDIAIFQWERIPFTPEGDVPDNFNLAPDWTIEILSPDQRPNNEVRSQKLEVRSCFCEEYLSPAPKTFRFKKPGFRPYYFDKVLGNILHCLEYGCHLGWFIDPDDLSILFLQPQQQPSLAQKNELLPVYPQSDLELTVSQVFGWLKMN